MKKTVIPCASMLFFTIISTQLTFAMPGSDADEDQAEAPAASAASNNSTSAPSTPSADTSTKKEDAPLPKAVSLQWPNTTEIAEDNKKLLQSNSKEIVQLFTQAQDVCKNMDETLTTLNKARNEANTKYRDTIKELDPLLALIGSAQAENKK